MVDVSSTVEIKKCSKCGAEKGLEEFSKQKRNPDGLRSYCRECASTANKARYARPEVKSRHKKLQKAWLDIPGNKELQKGLQKAWWAKPEVKERRNGDLKGRRRKDPWYKICCNMRTRMGNWVKKNSANKLISAVTDLGCEWPLFKPYLESKFYSHPTTGEVMSWENYGLWHLDHIYPLAKVDPTDIEQVKAAWHYTNYQPLWAEENIRKSDNIVGPRVVLK